jgi:pyruvate/2-oxoglutarate dehydrogenase complex dihydrolipoamide acyltransferase (E2) component
MTVDVPMPHMGTSVVEGTIIGWSKQVGDHVDLDEPLCEVTTDKVDTECPSPAAGVLAEILVDVGETGDVGTVLARIAVEGGVAVPAALAAKAPPAATAATPAAPASNGAAAANGNGAAGPRVSPVVARMAAVHDLDLAQVPGTGRGGRVTKKDVLAFLDRAPEPDERPLHSESPYRPDDAPPAPAPAPAAPPVPAPDDLGGVPQPLSRIRQAIGRAMLASQQTTATCHTVVECDMSRVENRRRDLGLTALPLVSAAVVETLRGFGQLNATLDGTTITTYERVHLGIAVSLGEEGLIVPVIHDAQDLSPQGLGTRIKDLARRARAGQLVPDDVQGATFTITNPGAFGATIATPIINAPQVAILDLEAIIRRPVVITDDDNNESIAIRPMVNLILGWDHRAIDGVYAAQFLTALRRRLEATG